MSGQQQACPVIKAFANQLRQEDFISLRVRRVLKLGKNLEMRFFDRNRASRLGAIFKYEHVSKPRTGGRAKGPFSIRGPKIGCVAQRFFGSVVEVIPERRPDLRLELDNGQQRTVGDNHQIPILLGPIEPGQFLPVLPEHVSFGQTGFDEQVAAYLRKPIEVFPARNRRASPHPSGRSCRPGPGSDGRGPTRTA